MIPPRLWVWIGSPDDRLDVMRYVSATDKDIMNQPVVVAEMARVCALVAELESDDDYSHLVIHSLERERDEAVNKLDDYTQTVRTAVDAITAAYHLVDVTTLRGQLKCYGLDLDDQDATKENKGDSP